MSEEQFCLLAEGSLFVLPSGSITPCCLLGTPKDSFGNIATSGLSEVFHSDKFVEYRNNHRKNILTKSCQNSCIDNVNNPTHRITRSNMLKDYHNKGDEYTKLNILDMGFGNVCKLTCTFCGPEFSSSWAKLQNKPESIYHFSKEEILNTVKDLKDVRYLSIKGGEPFNIPYIEDFIEELYKVNPGIVLDIMTSAVECSDRLITALSKFPRLGITVSIEATGDLYKYMRGGEYSWENNAFKTLEKFAELGLNKIYVATIISLHNYSVWPEQIFSIYKDLKSIIETVDIGTQLCLHPSNQDIFCVSKESRQQLVTRIADKVKQGLPLFGFTELSELLSQDRRSVSSKQEILTGIEYFNSLRNMELFSIVDNFMDDLSVTDRR